MARFIAKSLEVIPGSSEPDPKSRIVVVMCPLDYYALGGGAQIVGPTATTDAPHTVALSESRPIGGEPGFDAPPRGWSARAHEVLPTTTRWRLIVYAVCAKLELRDTVRWP